VNQEEINGALTIFIETGDSGPWLRVLEGIRDGTILAEPRKNTLTLTAVTRPLTHKFGQRLNRLRSESDVTMQQLAELLAVSPSAVIRQLRGQVLGSWPAVSMMITKMGGDPEDFKADFKAARTENRRYGGGVTHISSSQ
jgi:DNA-binding XRE family transcriptional regulator